MNRNVLRQSSSFGKLTWAKVMYGFENEHIVKTTMYKFLTDQD